jgi:hypothetical protein
MDAAVLLGVLLRFVGCLLLLAAAAIVMPFEWMAALHQALGLGGLPELPVIQYLTRSVSAVYATWGAFFLYLSFDVRRHLVVIRFLMVVKMLFALVLIAIDILAGMPWFWTVYEGPPILVIAAAMWWLSYRAEPEPRPRS